MFVYLTGLLALSAPPPLEVDKIKYEFALKRDGDTVTARTGKDGTTFVISSTTGIGGASGSQAEGKWPKDVIFHFQRTKGGAFSSLEGFTLTTDRFRITGSLKQSGKMELRFLGPDGKADERATVAGSVDVKVRARDNGDLEVVLPSNLLHGSRTVEITWIDAYRG